MLGGDQRADNNQQKQSPDHRQTDDPVLCGRACNAVAVPIPCTGEWFRCEKMTVLSPKCVKGVLSCEFGFKNSAPGLARNLSL